MRLRFNMRCSLLLMIVIVIGCSSNPPQDEPYQPTPGVSSSSAAAKGKPVTGIQMTYHNDASTLNMTLDPYDENLQIEMKRTPRPVEEKKPEPPPAPPKKDTVYMMAPSQPQATSSIMTAPAPTSVNVQLQLPPEKKDTTVSLNQKPVEAKRDTVLQIQEVEDQTDEVLADLRRAQDYFYRQDYNSVLRLVKSAQERRATAEGYSLQGSAYYMLGDKDLARYYWGQALKLNPNMPEVIDALSKIEPKPEVR